LLCYQAEQILKFIPISVPLQIHRTRYDCNHHGLPLPSVPLQIHRTQDVRNHSGPHQLFVPLQIHRTQDLDSLGGLPQNFLWTFLHLIHISIQIDINTNYNNIILMTKNLYFLKIKPKNIRYLIFINNI
jgi:hypothetical protein